MVPEEYAKNLLKIPASSWEQAKNFFAAHPDEAKFSRKISGMDYSFIKINNTIYAMAKGSYLGQGGFGNVKLIQTEEGYNYAVKIEGDTQEEERKVERDILTLLGELHGEAQRPYLGRRFFKGKTIQNKLYSVLTLQTGNTLLKTLNTKRMQGNVKALSLALLCAKALQRLHEKNVIHGDVQANNFMVNLIGDALIVAAIDFGLSLRVPPGQKRVDIPSKALPDWMAPEAALYRSFASDVYSLGFMILNYFSIKNDRLTALCHKMLEQDDSKRPPLPEVIAELAQILSLSEKESVNRLQNLEQNVRSRFDEIFFSFSKDNYTDSYSSRLKENDFIGFSPLEIKQALDRVAKEKGINIQFEVDMEEISIPQAAYPVIEQYYLNHDYLAKLRTYLEEQKRNAQALIDKLNIMKEALNVSPPDFSKLPSYREIEDIRNNFRKELYGWIDNTVKGLPAQIPKELIHPLFNELGLNELKESLKKQIPEIANICSEAQDLVYKHERQLHNEQNNKVAVYRRALLLEDEKRKQAQRKILEEEKAKKAQAEKQQREEQKRKEETAKREKMALHSQKTQVNHFIKKYLTGDEGRDIQKRFDNAPINRFSKAISMAKGQTGPDRQLFINLTQTLFNELYNERTQQDPLIKIKILKSYFELLNLQFKDITNSRLKMVIEDTLSDINKEFPRLSDYKKNEFQQYVDKKTNIKQDYPEAIEILKEGTLEAKKPKRHDIS